jgi:hypothetical protein
MTGNNRAFRFEESPCVKLRSWVRGNRELLKADLSVFSVTRFARRLAILSAVTALVGCGGGGGSGYSAPSITAQPQSATVNVGASATFSVSASGSDLAYQWTRGGQPIAGATDATYTLNSVTATDDQAQFAVSVSNASGQVTSTSAVLTVVSPPTITAHPTDTSAVAGSAVSFSVGASATHGTLAYQWYKGATALVDGDHVSGAKTAVLSLDQVTSADGGSYSAHVSNSAGSVSSNGATLTVITASRLVATALGVGFSQVGTRAVLQRRIQVFSDSGLTTVPWTASSDSTWLSVTASGNTGDNLVITASAVGASADQTEFGTITVTSANPTVTNQVTIRVGLYASSTAATSVALPIAVKTMATSPVEPLLAVAAAGTSVKLYNVYSGALVRTLSGVAAAAGPLTFSEDGVNLFVYDTTNLAVVQVDVSTGAVIRTYGASPPSNGFGTDGNAIAVLHPNGFPMLATPVGLYYDLTTGEQFADPNPSGAFMSSAFSFAVSPDQSLLAAQDGSTVRIIRSDGGSQFIVQHGAMSLPVNVVQNSANGQSCFSTTGDRLYTASGAPYQFPATSVTTDQVIQILPADAYPDAIQCVWNGLVVGGIDGYYSANDIYLYNGPSGTALGQLSSNGTTTAYRDLFSRGMAVSADGTVLASAWYVSSASTGVYLQALPSPQ